jgi:threonine dehydratase
VTVTLDDIAAARERIKNVVFTTPLRVSEWLSSDGAAVLLKLETIQPTSSYKIRGALNAAQRLVDDTSEAAGRLFDNAEAAPRLVTASAGNHGKALAYAARMLNLPLTVFIAANAPRAKIDAIRAAGADLRECQDYDAAERGAKDYAAAGHGIYISPYSHPDVIAGAGTIGFELFEEEPYLDAVVVPVGGGGLISGIGIALKALNPNLRVIGVEAAASCPFTKSLEAGHLVAIDVQPSLADGLTGNLDPDTITLDIVKKVVDEIVLVDEPLLRRSLAGVMKHEHILIEGAAAAGVAAILGGKVQRLGNVAVILTGANIDPERILDVLSS